MTLNVRENDKDIEETLRSAKFYAIDAVDIKPNDIIVIRLLQLTTMENAEIIRGRVKEMFPNNNVLVLNNGADLFVARKE